MSAAIGPVGFAEEAPGLAGDGQVGGRPYAEATQRRIDEEVARLLRRAEDRAYDLLNRHRTALERVADRLVEEETVDGEVIEAIAAEAPARELPEPESSTPSRGDETAARR